MQCVALAALKLILTSEAEEQRWTEVVLYDDGDDDGAVGHEMAEASNKLEEDPAVSRPL